MLGRARFISVIFIMGSDETTPDLLGLDPMRSGLTTD